MYENVVRRYQVRSMWRDDKIHTRTKRRAKLVAKLMWKDSRADWNRTTCKDIMNTTHMMSWYDSTTRAAMTRTKLEVYLVWVIAARVRSFILNILSQSWYHRRSILLLRGATRGRRCTWRGAVLQSSEFSMQRMKMYMKQMNDVTQSLISCALVIVSECCRWLHIFTLWRMFIWLTWRCFCCHMPVLRS